MCCRQTPDTKRAKRDEVAGLRLPGSAVGNEQVAHADRVLDDELLVPGKAPTAGQHADAVLADVLGDGAERIARLRESGALG